MEELFERICKLEQTAQCRYCSENISYYEWSKSLSKEELIELNSLYVEYYGKNPFEERRE